MIQNEKEKKGKPKSFYLEASRNGKFICVCLYGVIGIEEFSENRLLLKCRGGKIEINGVDLFLSTYENNVAEISGDVEEMRFV